ncbi:hypothetical protein ACHAXT_008918 [Thalassiosira profunda]
MSRSGRSHSASPTPPSVPSIRRRSSSSQREERGRVADYEQRVGRRATDEFGFPAPPQQQLRSASPQHVHATKTADLEKISNQSSSSSTKHRTKKGPRIKVSRPDPTKYKNYTFQHPAHAMRVSVRSVDLSHKIAFDTRIPPAASSASLQRMLEEMDRVRGSRSTLGSVIEDGKRRSDNPCRISPSPNHMALLEFMHGSRGVQSIGRERRRVVRQLQWNPACSVDADPWFDGSYEEDGRDTQHSLDGSSRSLGAKHASYGKERSQQMRRKPKSTHGDGRYIPINPLAVTRKSLPSHSPILTTGKRRLPMRSDVGFANPSPEEVAKKMEEVKKEAEWEEASPRVVLLASGFSLFQDEEEMDNLHSSCRTDVERWARGSIPGVPFAGRDLVSAYRWAAKFEQSNGADPNQNVGTARAYSVFAPPVDATFSSSQMWRPRPFMDRPPGYVYFLACPLDVRFESGDTEPFFCTMALYSLPKASDGNQRRFLLFPPGIGMPSSEAKAVLMTKTSGRKHGEGGKRRAIMCYDPLEVSADDLHLVVQVFRAKVLDDSGSQNPPATKRRDAFRNKVKGSLVPDALKGKSKGGDQSGVTPDFDGDLSQSRTMYEEVGARYLTPICFSVTPAFHAGDSLKGSLSRSAGYTDVLTSFLGMDFTRALLDEPPQLCNALDDAAPMGPQLLADVMGDCAISFDGPTLEGAKRQRSKLRRLPPSCESGYSSSFDLKEILYFPPRSAPRKYEDDTALCSSTVLNLLYIYPRLIRWSLAKTKGGRKEVPLNDEVKLRLPDILDRRHFLRFSLFSMRSDAGSELVAETAIPFIISSKESSSGGRVTTIIPNGLHRIQLDGTKASEAASDLDSSSSSSNVNTSSGSPFLDILTLAPGQAVKRHFSSLITAAMLSLVNQTCPPFYFEALREGQRLVAWEKIDPLLAIVRSLCEILEKTRTSYQERERLMLSVQYQRVVKSFLDAFDEPLFTNHGNSDDEMSGLEHADSASERHLNVSVASSNDFHDGEHYDEPSLSLSKAKEDRRARIPKYRIKSPRNDIAPRSFSRRAFVATKSELMKAEAELHDDDDYFDDDETIATLGTVISADAGSVFPLILESKSYESVQRMSSVPEIEEEPSSGWACGSGIVSTPPKPKRSSPQPTGSSTPFSFASKRAEYMANRVNNVAQLVMAPCIAPSVDGSVHDGVEDYAPAKSSSLAARNKSPFEPSSDAEEEGSTKRAAPYLRGNQACLKIPPLIFEPMRDVDGSSANGDSPPFKHPPHLYEVIIALWVHSWTSSAASMKSDAQSIGLRSAQNNTTKLIVPMTLLDDNHLQILVLFVETIALGLMREGMSGSSGVANSDRMLAQALSSSDCVLDFFIGLFALLHPSQVAALLSAYFDILESVEDPVGTDGGVPGVHQ